MLKIKKIHRKKLKRKSSIFFLLIFILSFLFIISENNFKSNPHYDEDESIKIGKQEINKRPKISALWAWLNLTNLAINNTRHYHNASVPIEGRLFDPIPPQNGFSGYKVALNIDGILFPEFNNITDLNGIFKIYNYTIPPSMNIYKSYKIEAEVIGPTPGDVILKNHFMIAATATSYFDTDNYNLNIPQLAGGYYNIPGFLNYDNHTGIPNQIINSIWKNETSEYFVPPNAPFNTNSDGSFKYIPIPDDNVSNVLYLNLTYTGFTPYINGSQKQISISLYRNITCVWDTVGSATEGNKITIKGQLFDRNNPNLKINNTDVQLEFINGPSIGNSSTDDDGNFTCNYQIPLGFVGNNLIKVKILNFSNIYSNTLHFISISSAPPPPITPAEDIGDDGEETPPPFQNFFIIFIPIIIGFAAALVVFIIIHLRKQKEEAQLVKLPLEDKIRNLKILKDTGRLEEALSYLFQSIYIELIYAKYGRKKKENETIRDFAIISVRELKLNPTSIYPFIQNIEKIIYDKPFIIKDKDFYASVELFSPIYFELTGYQFILNF